MKRLGQVLAIGMSLSGLIAVSDDSPLWADTNATSSVSTSLMEKSLVTRMPEHSVLAKRLGIGQGGQGRPLPPGQWPPLLHLAPTQNGATPGKPFIEACLHMDEWAAVLARTTHFGNADWVFADAAAERLADSDLTRCFANMHARQVKLVLESGVIKPQCIGEDCFLESSRIYDRLIGLGASLDVVSMDSPFGDAKYVRPIEIARAISETVRWIALVRARYPSAQIIDIEQLNGGLTQTELFSWMVALSTKCREVGVRPPDFFEIDHDWTSGGWSWDGIATLQATANALGMKFGVIFWAANKSSDKSATDQDWYNSLLDQGDMYLRNYQSVPDLYSVNDWLAVPTQTLPENTTRYTFMKAVYDFTWRYMYPFDAIRR